MPLVDDIQNDEFTRVVTWQVSETEEELLEQLNLTEFQLKKFRELRPKQAKEYLGLRAALQELEVDYDVLYNERGKPYLPTGKEVSITHSYEMVSVGVSKFHIGVDIELERIKKIKNIRRKFIRKDESLWLPDGNESDYLHIIWGIKEGLYKLNGGNLWNFLHHYKVEKFDLIENKPITCWISDENKSRKYNAYYKMIGKYYLIWVLDYE